MSAELSELDAGHGAAVHHQPLVLILAAAAAGIFIDRTWPIAAASWWIAAAGLLFAWALAWRSRRDWLSSWLLLSCMLATGGAWHHDRWFLFRDDEAGRMVGEEIRPLCLEAIAVTSPRWSPAPPRTALRTIPKGDETELMLEVTAVRDGEVWRPASGRGLMDVDGHLPGVRAGDSLRIMALASRPMSPHNPNEFNYADYERSRRIWVRIRGLFPESVERLDRGSSWSPRLLLANVRDSGNGLLRRHISPGRSPLAAAILLGAREQLDPDRNEGFLVTGTIHVLSISGLHVGILAYGFWLVFRTGLLPRRTTLFAAILLTGLYALLTDLQPPVLRAATLVAAMCLAKLLGRRALGMNTLAFAGIAVLAQNPASLFMAGPQLSFLSVAVMILFNPLLGRPRSTDPLERLIASSRPPAVRAMRVVMREVWRVWLMGALIWLIALPIVWKQYNLLSPVALLINMIMWIPITVALWAGFLALLTGWIFPALGSFFGWLCDANLQFIEVNIELFRDAPYSYFWLPAPPAWWIAVFYIALGLAAAFPPLRPRRHWYVPFLVSWLVTAWILSGQLPRRLAQPGPQPLTCTFISVGHGVSCVLELPDGRTILYDSGKLGSPLGAVRPTSAVLWSRGVTHLDAVMVSHADADHFNAIPELLERFSVGAIYVSPVMFEHPQAAVEEFRIAVEQAGVPLRLIHAHERFRTETDVSIEILHPPRKGVIGSDNANSILLLVEYAGKRILLTGDLESPGIDDVMAEDPLDCDIVLAPHHGSLRSNPEGFAGWSTPDFVVISGGRNVEDIPNIESVKNAYRRRQAQVFHTAEDGCVQFEVDAGGIRVETFRSSRR